MKKKLIRNNVFETNSSSCHSITINKCDSTLYGRLYPNDDGDIVFEGGEFGWGYDLYTDAPTKANYIATAIHHLENAAEDFNTANEERKKVFLHYSLPEFADKNYFAIKSIFEKVVRNQTGCNNIIYNFSTKYDSNTNHAYIDHQSFEDAKDAEWLLNEEQIFDFIFSPNSELVIDNDNH
jgi:hypothetical protein